MSPNGGLNFRNTLDTTPTPSNTVVAASCSQAHVQAAIDAAPAGYTVSVPPGSIGWSTYVLISGKSLSLVGAGIGQTVIYDDTTGTGPLLLDVSATNFVSVSGFTFVKRNTNAAGMIQIYGPQGEVAFRFHHNRLFDNGVGGGRGIYVYQVYGLIDHNVIDVTDTTSSDQMISVDGSYVSTDGGYTPWMQPLTLGTNKAVYVEDCVFTIASQHEDVIDAYSGARLVVRHNAFNDTSVGLHGTDSGGNRSPVSLEMYANTFTNNSATARRAVTHRGGTAVYFDNTFSGSQPWSGFNLIYYRATIIAQSWGQCDGTVYDIGSASLSSDLSRQVVSYGAGARFLASNPDTVCSGAPGGDCTRAFDGAGSRGYPGRDQPGRGPNGQTLSPVYAWNNTPGIDIGVNDGGCGICSGYPATTWMAENRDFYNYVSAGFNGTVGVGRGPLTSRPSTCVPLTAYFATDVGAQGTLYQCTSTNVWTAYYTPYTYPHPLTA